MESENDRFEQPAKPSRREEEAMRVAQEYAEEQRAVLEKLRRILFRNFS